MSIVKYIKKRNSSGSSGRGRSVTQVPSAPPSYSDSLDVVMNFEEMPRSEAETSSEVFVVESKMSGNRMTFEFKGDLEIKMSRAITMRELYGMAPSFKDHYSGNRSEYNLHGLNLALCLDIVKPDRYIKDTRYIAKALGKIRTVKTFEVCADGFIGKHSWNGTWTANGINLETYWIFRSEITPTSVRGESLSEGTNGRAGTICHSLGVRYERDDAAKRLCFRIG